MFRFCSKTVPERGRRALRRRSGERSVALQELPQNAGYRLVTGEAPEPNSHAGTRMRI